MFAAIMMMLRWFVYGTKLVARYQESMRLLSVMKDWAWEGHDGWREVVTKRHMHDILIAPRDDQMTLWSKTHFGFDMIWNKARLIF